MGQVDLGLKGWQDQVTIGMRGHEITAFIPGTSNIQVYRRRQDYPHPRHVPDMDHFQQSLGEFYLLQHCQHEILDAAQPESHIDADAPTSCEEDHMLLDKPARFVHFRLELRNIFSAGRCEQELQSFQVLYAGD